MGSLELALPTSIAGGVNRGADTDLSSTALLAKKGEAGEIECSEKVVVGELIPSGLGEDDFQPKKDESLFVGEFFLLLGEGLELLDPIELSEMDLGRRPLGYMTTKSGVCRYRTGVGDRLLDLEV